eukprot:1664566-Karenia_brevis.AAC.1
MNESESAGDLPTDGHGILEVERTGAVEVGDDEKDVLRRSVETALPEEQQQLTDANVQITMDPMPYK